MRADDGLHWSTEMEMVGIGESQDVIWGWKQHGLNMRERETMVWRICLSFRYKQLQWSRASY